MTCQTTCGGADQTDIDGICQVCQEPCATCEGTTSTCTSCISEYYLFNPNTCVQYCPTKYIVNDANTTCVYEGLVCPDKFELNEQQNGCRPLLYACDPGYEINENESGCIPVAGS